jgi:gliding motility-associated-like protein
MVRSNIKLLNAEAIGCQKFLLGLFMVMILTVNSLCAQVEKMNILPVQITSSGPLMLSELATGQFSVIAFNPNLTTRTTYLTACDSVLLFFGGVPDLKFRDGSVILNKPIMCFIPVPDSTDQYLFFYREMNTVYFQRFLISPTGYSQRSSPQFFADSVDGPAGAQGIVTFLRYIRKANNLGFYLLYLNIASLELVSIEFDNAGNKIGESDRYSPQIWVGSERLNNNFFNMIASSVLIVGDNALTPSLLSKLNFNNSNGSFGSEVHFYTGPPFVQQSSVPHHKILNGGYISSDGSILYMYKQTGTGSLSPEIVAYDISSNDSSLIRQSERSLMTLNSHTRNGQDWFVGQNNRVYLTSTTLSNGVFGYQIHELINPNDFANSWVDTAVFNFIGTFGFILPFPDFYNNPNRYGLSAHEGRCLGDTTRFKLFDYHNLQSVLWQFGDSTAAGTDTSSNPRPSYVYPQAGRYTVTAYVTYCNRNDTLVQEIEILAPPLSPELPDTTLCAGSNLPLVLASQASNSIVWSNGDSTWSTSYTTGGWHWAEISNACFSTRDSFYITLHEPPQSGLLSDTNVCAGTSLTLTPQPGDYTWRWQDGSTQPLTVTEAGTYALLMTNACGTFVHEVRIDYQQAPELNLNDTSRCEGQFYRIELPEVWQGSYQWTDGSSERVRILTDSGWYSAEVSNPCGTASDQFYLSLVDCECHMYLPTAFSPNGDGLNDELIIKTRCELSSYQMEVYDRWGRQIFTSNNLNRGWDGTFQGQDVPNGSYPFIIRYTPEGRNPRVEKGIVSVLR